MASGDQLRLIAEIARRAQALDQDTKRILSSHEDSSARVFTLESSFAALEGLSLEQDEVFREALRAVELSLYRAAHVLAFAAFIDWFHRWLWDGHEAALTQAYPKWGLSDVEDLREHADFQVIEAGRVVGAYRQAAKKALHGLLNRRNECAHPSNYFPDRNETLGYIGEVFKRLEGLTKRS